MLRTPDCSFVSKKFGNLERWRVVQQGAQVVCHNLPHETLVICREVQKLNLPSAMSLLESLFSGHCTSSIARRRYGYRRRLSDEFRSCIGEEGFNFTDHNPGHDAAKCARLFLHYNEARVVSACTSAGPPAKKSRVVERAWWFWGKAESDIFLLNVGVVNESWPRTTITLHQCT